MNCDNALLLEKVPPVAEEQRLAVASVRMAVKVWGEDVFKVIAVLFAVEKHMFHCHIARRIGIG